MSGVYGEPQQQNTDVILCVKYGLFINKEEFCSLADYGYRILVNSVEAKDEYPILCPVLLLCGEKDAAGSAKSYNRRWTKQDGHPLVWLKGAGHNSNTDTPDEVNRLIEKFVNSLKI